MITYHYWTCMYICMYAGSSACNWACQDTGECLSDYRRCNGQVDCNEGSDEHNYSKSYAHV